MMGNYSVLRLEKITGEGADKCILLMLKGSLPATADIME